MKHAQKNLLILGVHLSSDGYPNVKYRIEALKENSSLHTFEINYPIWEKSANTKKHSLVFTILRAMWAHCFVLYKYLTLKTKIDSVYIPYPGIFICALLSYLPAIFRPNRMILDAFISLYDTVVLDRKLIKSRSLIAILLKYIEHRAFQYANAVITDTKQNAVYLHKIFNLPEEKFIDIPLSTDEKNFKYSPYIPTKKPVKVLFIGTLIPLHGIEFILDAIEQLKDKKQFDFTIIGDGQKARDIARFLEEDPNIITWIREWQSSKSLSSYIRDSDICLGIFGTGAKTQRVCPLKIYAYAACSRPIITGETDWSLAVLNSRDQKPFATIPVGDSAALAKEIIRLAESLELRVQLANSSHLYYSDKLTNERAISLLLEIL